MTYQLGTLTFIDGIGRSRSGDQLHKFTGRVEADGRVLIGGANAHCNNHMHLQPLGSRKGGEKHAIKVRANLFCKKCFGPNVAGQEFFNCTVTE